MKTPLYTLFFFFVVLAGLSLEEKCRAQETYDLSGIDSDYFEFKVTVSREVRQKLDKIKAKYGKQLDALTGKGSNEKQAFRLLKSLMAEEVEQQLTEGQLEKLNVIRKSNSEKKTSGLAAFLKSFAGMSGSIAAADKIVIYEGLPRAESSEIEALKKKHRTFVAETFDFFQEPLKVSRSRLEGLRTAITEFKEFMPYRGAKFCGGFHPDFLLEWESDGSKHQLFVCLGCHEVLYVGGGLKNKMDYSATKHLEFLLFAGNVFVKNTPIKELADVTIQNLRRSATEKTQR